MADMVRIRELIENIGSNSSNPNKITTKDGRAYCKVCGEPLQRYDQKYSVYFPRMCSCQLKERREKDARRKQTELEMARAKCFGGQDKARLKGATFENDKGYNNIDNAHDGNQNTGNLGQALGTAHDADGEQNSQNAADDPGSDGLAVEAEAGKCGLQVVGSQSIVTNGVGQDDDHGEDHAQPTLMQSSLHVVGGAAEAGAVLIALLINLSQSGLDESRSTANQGDQPHPEHTTHTAQADGGGHADDVTGTHAGCGRNHQSAEGRNGVAILGLFGHNTNGFAEQAELYALGANGEIQATANQEYDDEGNGQLRRTTVKEVADRVNNAINLVNHETFLSFTFKFFANADSLSC